MITTTLREIKQKILTEEEKEMIRNAVPTEDEDCPFMSDEDLKGFRSGRLNHPEWFRDDEKTEVNLLLSNNVYDFFSKKKNFKEEINHVLEDYVNNETEEELKEN